jgi:hypothetical protein
VSTDLTRRLKTTRCPNQQHKTPAINSTGNMMAEWPSGLCWMRSISQEMSIVIAQAPNAMNGMPTIMSIVRWMKRLMPRLYRERRTAENLDRLSHYPIGDPVAADLTVP